jgi:hypothetical protein
VAVSLTLNACGGDGTQGRHSSTATAPQTETTGNDTTESTSQMKIRLTVGQTVLQAVLTDNATTRDLVSLLPLTLRMSDLFGRERYGHLTRTLAAGGPRQHSFEVGDIAYWPPGPDIAIFYNDDGPSIPNPGITVLGKIGSGVEVLKSYAGSITIDLVD